MSSDSNSTFINPALQHHEQKSLRAFIPALLMIVLLTGAAYSMDFEPGSSLNTILPILPAVFAFHYWLPKNTAVYFLSFSGIVSSYLILDVYNATALLLCASVFAGLIQTQIIRPKVKLILGILLLFLIALFRTGLLSSPFISYAAPVAGSLLMFRGILMLYEQHYYQPASTFQQKFAYILLLPNFAFPLFPIIDYKLFLNNYNPSNIHAIQKGIRRILLGILQLLLYRTIYLHVLPLQSELVHSSDAMLYLLSSYLLVLHLTGLIWMATGYMGIIGFDLPPAFNGVFLVENFRAIWRRINIYWREFMMKIFYYPIYFRFRKKLKHAVLISAGITLTISTIMHGWQWFWLQGVFTIQTTTLLYWLILGSCITYSLSRQEQDKNTPDNNSSIRSFFSQTLSVFLMYLVMSVLWSLWSSSSISEWIYFMKKLVPDSSFDFLMTVALLVTLYLILLSGKKIFERKSVFEKRNAIPLYFFAALVLFAVSNPYTQRILPNYIQRPASDILQPILNADDRNEVTENYYSRMLSTEGKGRKPWEAILKRGEARSGLDNACIIRNDLVVRELIPSRTTQLDGWTIITNSAGMRDREYAKEKSADKLRIAVLGGSYEMGSGVNQEYVFEHVLEKMLQDSIPSKPTEILNFAVGGYHLPQQVWVLENKAASFQPDVVLCFIHPSDARRNSNYLAQLIKNGTDLIYPELYDIKTRSGADQNMSMNELKNRLSPYNKEITEWSMKRMEAFCSKLSIELTYIYLPALFTYEDDYDQYVSIQNQSNEKSSFPYIIKLDQVYAGTPAKFGLKNDPSHPNAEGHRKIATALYQKLSPYIRNYKRPNKTTS
ncbi:MAG: hypothetical protein Fur0041_07990 [Bacteroidia bacterium]